MKRIGLISDTHSCFDENFREVFAECDEIWHCGDIGDMSVAEELSKIAPLRGVSGNIDHGEVRRVFPECQLFDCEGVRVFLTHIGGYPGKYAPGIRNILKKEGVKLFVDGHSHILRVMPDRQLGLLHINPGAAGTQGWQKKRTLVRIILDEGDIKNCEVIELNSLRRQNNNPTR